MARVGLARTPLVVTLVRGRVSLLAPEGGTQRTHGGGSTSGDQGPCCSASATPTRYGKARRPSYMAPTSTRDSQTRRRAAVPVVILGPIGTADGPSSAAPLRIAS